MTSREQNTPDRDNRAAVAFHPPLLLLAFIAGGFLEQWLVPLPFLPPALAWPVGVPVTVLAFALFAWAVVTMRRGGASIPTHLPTDAIVERGPFRFSRNPIYLSMTVLLVGIGLWANSIWFLTWAVLAVALLTVYVVMPEEQYLERKFGQAYLSYKGRVRRWF